jgi:hypothetical protein
MEEGVMHILALDPGQTVGWASFYSEAPQPYTYTSGEVPVKAIWSLMEQATSICNLDVLIYESFELIDSTFPNLAPVECIGVIKEWAHQYNVKLEHQTAQEAKLFWTDERLKEYGVYNKGKRHGNDAMRHLMYYLHFRMNKPLKKTRVDPWEVIHG